MWSVALKKLNSQRVASGMSYAAIANATGYAQSSIHRWYSGEAIPDMDQTERVYTSTGGNIRDLFDHIGTPETEAANNIPFMGADLLAAEYDKREKLVQDHCAQLVQHQIDMRAQQQAAFDSALSELKASHREILTEMRRHNDASVSHLKAQNKNLRTALAIMLALFVLSVTSLVLVLAVDVPHIGAGGSVFASKNPRVVWLWLLGILCAALAVAYVVLLIRHKSAPHPPASTPPQNQ